MSYEYYSGLDSQFVSDGDGGFVGMDMRTPLWLMGKGYVRWSGNGRFDGSWVCRDGIVSIGNVVSSGLDPLRLPFFVFSEDKVVSGVVVDGGDVVFTVVGHGFEDGLEGWVLFEGLDDKFNKYIKVLVDGVDELRYVGGNDGFGVVDVVGVMKVPVLSAGSDATVYGSCVYSSPNGGDDVIFFALNKKCVVLSLSGLVLHEIDYPSAETIDDDVEMIQAFDKVIVFRGGFRAFTWGGDYDEAFKYVLGGDYGFASRYGDSSNLNINQVGFEGLAVVTVTSAVMNRSGILVGDGGTSVILPSEFSDGTKVSLEDDFYNGLSFNLNGTTRTVSDYVGASRKLILNGGSYTSGVSYEFSLFPLIIFNIGDSFTVLEDVSGVASLVSGAVFNINKLVAWNKFAFASSEATHSGKTMHYGADSSGGLGFSRMPAPPWGYYFQRRLWLPYYYRAEGTSVLPSYIYRDIRDELVVSDILDLNTYDISYNQFRITGGTSDYIVAFKGFYEDNLIVLNRNSLHMIAKAGGGLSDVSVKELTNEVGCVARKSVVIHGANLMFLSDNGVYMLEFIDQYNLRGVDLPLSYLISPLTDRINKNLSSSAVGIYFDNRYWLAVPLDSSVGSNDARGNNAILIYNFINKAWESVDTVDDAGFLIKSLYIAQKGSKNNLYASTINGGVHLLNDKTSKLDKLAIEFDAGPVIKNIDASLMTRGYSMSTTDRKRFTDIRIQAESSDNLSSFDIGFSTQDPDSVSLVGNSNDFLLEELSQNDSMNVLARVGGYRGGFALVSIKPVDGNPIIRSITVSATLANRAILSQS